MRLLNTGKARITQHVPFTIQLLYDNIPVLQPITFAEDPGRTNIGMATLSLEGKLLFSAICETRNKEIAKLMEDRKNHRRASRYGERRGKRDWLAKQFGTVLKAGMMMRKLHVSSWLQ
ncbi:MAG: RRXRR domain-containing protein [Lachnospiraceae bacterium]